MPSIPKQNPSDDALGDRRAKPLDYARTRPSELSSNPSRFNFRYWAYGFFGWFGWLICAATAARTTTWLLHGCSDTAVRLGAVICILFISGLLIGPIAYVKEHLKWPSFGLGGMCGILVSVVAFCGGLFAAM